MSRILTEEEFNAWRGDPTTQELMKLLAAKREELRQAWEGGSFADYEKDTTVLVNVGNLGTCKGYAFVQELTYEQYLSEVEDGKSERAQAPRSSSVNQSV
mgnify:CR=1 FL=1